MWVTDSQGFPHVLKYDTFMVCSHAYGAHKQGVRREFLQFCQELPLFLLILKKKYLFTFFWYCPNSVARDPSNSEDL